MGAIQLDTGRYTGHNAVIKPNVQAKAIQPDPPKNIDKLKSPATQVVEDAEYTEAPKREKLTRIDIYV